MSTTHIKHIGTGLVGLVLAILFLLHTATHPENTTITVKTQTHPTGNTTPPRARFQSSTHRNEDMELKHFQNSDFYRTIIDNNIFRPLGWTPPRPIEPYRLIGTILPTDDRTQPTAILQTTTGQRTLIVSTGEKIDASTKIIEIKRKAVVLETEGQQRTLRLSIGF